MNTASGTIGAGLMKAVSCLSPRQFQLALAVAERGTFSGRNGDKLPAHRVQGSSTMKTLITRRQALAATCGFALAPLAAKASEKVGMQLILAADVSGSVNPSRYRIQQDGYLEALGDPRVMDVIRELDPPVLAITFVAWSRDQEVMVPWTRVEDARSMDSFRTRLKNVQRPRIGINT